MTDSLSERRLAAAEGAIAELVHRESWSARELATRALAASDTALATATSEEQVEQMRTVYHDAYNEAARGNGSPVVAHEAGVNALVRAASAVLLAPAMQQVERLAHESGMLDEQIAALRQENERQKAEIEERRRIMLHSADVVEQQVKALDEIDAKNVEVVATLRQRLAETEATLAAVRQANAALNAEEAAETVRLCERLDAAEQRAGEMEADAARWNYVRRGLFVTPHSNEEGPEVVFQGAMLDELARRMYPELPKGARGIVWDVTPVVDALLATAPTRPASSSPAPEGV